MRIDDNNGQNQLEIPLQIFFCDRLLEFRQSH